MRRSRLTRRPGAALVIVPLTVLVTLAGWLGSVGPVASGAAQAATTLPGQSDGVRVTPISRIVGDKFRQITGMDTDPTGNIYVSGYGYDSDITLNDVPSRHLTTGGSSTSLGGRFLLKLSAAGSIQWSVPLPSDYVDELEVDTSGNVYAVGRTSDGIVGGVAIPNPSFPSSPYTGAYVAKFKADGTGAQWAAPTTAALSIGISPTASFVYVVGSNATSPILARIDPSNGATLWQAAFGGEGTAFYERFTDVAVLADGSPVAAGFFQSTLFLDYPQQTQPITPQDGSTLAVRYDTNGVRQWFRQIGGTDTFTRTRIAALPDGNVAVASSSRYFNAHFGNITPPATGYDYAFTTKLNAANSNFVWTSFITSDTTLSTSHSPMFDLSGLDVDPAGNLVYGATFLDKATVYGAFVNGSGVQPGSVSFPLADRNDLTVSLTPAGVVRLARPTTGADSPNFGYPLKTREVRFGESNDIVQAGHLFRSLIGAGEPGALTMAGEVQDSGVYLARLRIGGATARPPEPPTNVAAWSSTDSAQLATAATVSWKPPKDTGGTPITNFHVTLHCNRVDPGAAIPEVMADVAPPATRVTLSSLPVNSPFGCNWNVFVRADNAQGQGAQAAFVPLSGLGSGTSGFYSPSNNPRRIMDTRDGTGPVTKQKLGPGQTIDLLVDRDVAPNNRSTAVALNITAVFPTADTHLTVWPRGEALPETSTLNASTGSVVPNFVITKVDSAGFVTIRNNAGNVDVLVDLIGSYLTFPSSFTDTLEPLQPARLLDTRIATGVATTTPIGQLGHVTFPVAGRLGVPAGNVATAVIVNVTGTGPTAPTHLTLSTSPTSFGSISTLNLQPGQTAANYAIAPIASDGTISLFNNSGTTHAIVDVVGYFHHSLPNGAPTVTGNAYRTISPARALDTRDGTGLPGGTPHRVAGQGVVTLKLSDLPELQLDGSPITAVTLNLTAVGPTLDTHITAYPGTSGLPLSSSLNLPAGAVRANLVTVPVGTDGTIALRNNSGSVDLIVDVVGSYVASP